MRHSCSKHRTIESTRGLSVESPGRGQEQHGGGDFVDFGVAVDERCSRRGCTGPRNAANPVDMQPQDDRAHLGLGNLCVLTCLAHQFGQQSPAATADALNRRGAESTIDTMSGNPFVAQRWRLEALVD